MTAGKSDIAKRAAALAESFVMEPALSFVAEMRDAFPEAEWHVVGGAVRDGLLGRPVKDFDVVVRRAPLQRIAEALAERGSVNFVGRHFGVLKFRPEGAAGEVDIAWPRTERAGGSGGYRDFSIQADPELAMEADLSRRDFTVNAMGLDLGTGTLLDPFGGSADLAAGVIRAVREPSERFAEDYSRMLRGVRFACQLGFAIEAATWEAMLRLMPRLDDTRATDGGAHERVVPYETVAKEITKAFAADAAHALELLEESGALFRLIPELVPLATCVQSPGQHSEGDVWAHTRLAMRKLAGPDFTDFFPGEAPDAETAFAVLLHDVAKPQTAAPGPDHVTFYGHAEAGALIAKQVALRLRLASAGIDADGLAWLVKMHLLPNMVDVNEVRRTTLVKHFLADRAAGRRLLHLAYADASASLRPDGTTDLSNLRRLLDALKALDGQTGGSGAPPKLLSGDEVMAIAGVGAGPDVGKLLEALHEAQLKGEVMTEAQAREFLKGAHS